MAGDWTPMRNDLRDDPAVISMAMALKIDPDAVVGKCLAVWAWAGAHTTSGRCVGVSKAHVDHAARCEKFGDAMELAGWLDVDGDGNVTLPRWKKWNGKAGKNRVQSAHRMARKRWQDSLREQRNGSVTVTMQQNRTEQQSNSRAKEEKSKTEQQSKASSAPPLRASSNGLRSAAAASPQDPVSLCRGIWRDQAKADTIALLEGATTERILWLIWRTRTEKPPVRRPQGFIEKGIRAKWDIDPVWLGKYEAERARLNGAHA